MSSSITITDLVLGNPNSTEDPKIANNFSALKTWFSNPQISSGDLATGAVTSAKIGNGEVKTANLETSTSVSTGITSAKIADSAVTTAKIANSTGSSDGITTSKLATSAVTTDKISATSVARSKIRVFTVPESVTTLPALMTGTTTFSNATPVTQIAYTTSGVPQVGQAVSGTGIDTDTVITVVSGASSPYTLTLNRPTVQTASGTPTITVKPSDNDEVFYTPSSNTGSLATWHMRYNDAVAAWDYVGGSNIVVWNDYTASGGANTSTNWSFPAINSGTIPNTGEYEIVFGVDFTAVGSTGTGGYVCLASPAVLDGAINNSATAINLTAATQYVASQVNTGANNPVMQIDSELMSYPYTSVSGSTITAISRGYNSTSPNSHADGSTVRFVTEAEAAIMAANTLGSTGWTITLQKQYRKKGLAAGKTFGIAYRRSASGSTNVSISNPYVALRPVRIV